MVFPGELQCNHALLCDFQPKFTQIWRQLFHVDESDNLTLFQPGMKGWKKLLREATMLSERSVYTCMGRLRILSFVYLCVLVSMCIYIDNDFDK